MQNNTFILKVYIHQCPLHTPQSICCSLEALKQFCSVFDVEDHGKTLCAAHKMKAIIFKAKDHILFFPDVRPKLQVKMKRSSFNIKKKALWRLELKLLPQNVNTCFQIQFQVLPSILACLHFVKWFFKIYVYFFESPYNYSVLFVKARIGWT